jgi:TRAP-type C4-dicarboxylate transport system permease small subunit
MKEVKTPTPTTCKPAVHAQVVGGCVARALVGFADRFNAALFFLLSCEIGVLGCLGLAQVVSRYVFGSPLVWSEEIIRYALIWTVFLGAGVAVRKGQLAAVELVRELVPATIRKVLVGASLAISGAFWAVLLTYGIIILDAVQGMRSGALELHMPMVYLAIPVGAGIALINTIVIAIDGWESTVAVSIDLERN